MNEWMPLSISYFSISKEAALVVVPLALIIHYFSIRRLSRSSCVSGAAAINAHAHVPHVRSRG